MTLVKKSFSDINHFTKYIFFLKTNKKLCGNDRVIILNINRIYTSIFNFILLFIKIYKII